MPQYGSQSSLCLRKGGGDFISCPKDFPSDDALLTSAIALVPVKHVTKHAGEASVGKGSD